MDANKHEACSYVAPNNSIAKLGEFVLKRPFWLWRFVRKSDFAFILALNLQQLTTEDTPTTPEDPPTTRRKMISTSDTIDRPRNRARMPPTADT